LNHQSQLLLVLPQVTTLNNNLFHAQMDNGRALVAMVVGTTGLGITSRLTPKHTVKTTHTPQAQPKLTEHAKATLDTSPLPHMSKLVPPTTISRPLLSLSQFQLHLMPLNPPSNHTLQVF
jgi:hypothetical protein